MWTDCRQTRRLLQFQVGKYKKHVIHITCPAIPYCIISSNEKIWYNKIYSSKWHQMQTHLPTGCTKTIFFSHTKNVTRYLCITTSFQKVSREILAYCYNNLQNKNVTECYRTSRAITTTNLGNTLQSRVYQKMP